MLGARKARPVGGQESTEVEELDIEFLIEKHFKLICLQPIQQQFESDDP